MILFDLDGTLISAGEAQRRAIEKATLDVFGIDRSLLDVPHHGATMLMILTRLVQRPVQPGEREAFVAAHAATLEAELPNSGALIDGVQECLSALWARGERLGVITGNSAAATAVALRHFGIASYIETGFFGDASPSREELVAQAVTAHVRPVIVGDTPLDVGAARVHHCPAVAVATGAYSLHELAPLEPDLLLPDLRDAAEALVGLRKATADRP